jgi:hypothetical protein
MTLRNNGRVAGFAFLIYIAVSLAGMFLAGSASRGDGAAAKLAHMAQHAGALRLALLFDLVGCFCALVLAATLWSITRGVDRDLAFLAALCRFGEGVTGALSLPRGAGRLWLATHAGALDPAASGVLSAVLLNLPSWSMEVGATLFSVGSLLFAWLFLRGRIVPAALAGLGVFASLVTAVGLPLQLVGLLGRPVTDGMWVPMLVYEVWLAVWLIAKGPRAAAGSPAA